MPRRRAATRRHLPPDTSYQSERVARLINAVMMRGKKSLAERIVYMALDSVREKAKDDPLSVLDRAMQNITPVLEVKPRRVGGATYQVPVEVSLRRSTSLAMRWLVVSARARTGRPMVEKLAAELVDAAQGQGAAVKKRTDTHRMAEANRAFVHYRW